MGPLWDIYLKLARRRTAGMDGPNPLSHAELEAFCRMTRTTLSAWEVDLLMRMDDAQLGAWYGVRAAERAKNASKSDPSAIPVKGNGAAIKALFQGLAARKAVTHSS